MKTIIASAALLLCATASARNLKITVSDLRSDKGRILWYIHGDARPRQGKSPNREASLSARKTSRPIRSPSTSSTTKTATTGSTGATTASRPKGAVPAPSSSPPKRTKSGSGCATNFRKNRRERPRKHRPVQRSRRQRRRPERPTNWTADRNKFIPLQRKDTRTWKRRDSMRPKAWR